MARPIKNGGYVVPESILALRPDKINSTVKAIPTMTKKKGLVIHYYVYERLSKIDPVTNTKKFLSGDCLGKIEGGMFCPNNRGREVLQAHNQSASNCENIDQEQKHQPDHDSASDGSKLSNQSKEMDIYRAMAANLNLELEDIDLELKNYGEYALVMACTASVLERLNRYFSVKDATLIYVLSIIYFIEEYTHACYVKYIFDESILSIKWPTLPISENTIGKFLWLLGRHPATCGRYCQDLIDQSSGLTAIDGHVILTCSRRNDLADYGNKYQKFGNKQLNILQAYDVNRKAPIASKAYEGGLSDKFSVQDLLDSYHFPKKTTFLIDMGFYSEEDMGIYREEGRHFIIPVPENTVISKMILSSVEFTNSFIYEKRDENGKKHNNTIRYKETTVKEMEDQYQRFVDEEAARKTREAASNCKEGEKPKKYYSRKITRSEFGDDRLIMYRDEDMHNKMVAEFVSQLGEDDQHTEERLAKLGPLFGVIVLRTNMDKEHYKAEIVYKNYKSRWTIETHFNFVANTIKFCGLQTEDYSRMQGLSFLILTVGQIKEAVVSKMKASSEPVCKKPLKECILRAAHLKLCQHVDKTWHVAKTTVNNATLMKEMGVDVAGDIKKLDAGIY